MPVIVIGGGGHAKVLISTLHMQKRRIFGFVDIDSSLPPVLGVERLGDDDAVLQYSPAEVELVNGIGSVGCTRLRRALFEKFVERGYRFSTVIHPRAVVAPEVEIDEGVQLMAGCVIQPGTCLRENVIVNTGACIDHDCLIERHAHIAPRATLCGGVRVGSGSQVGAGSSVIQGITIGPHCIVGAGAVVIDDVPEGVTVGGVPARVLASRTNGH